MYCYTKIVADSLNWKFQIKKQQPVELRTGLVGILALGLEDSISKHPLSGFYLLSGLFLSSESDMTKKDVCRHRKCSWSHTGEKIIIATIYSKFTLKFLTFNPPNKAMKLYCYAPCIDVVYRK